MCVRDDFISVYRQLKSMQTGMFFEVILPFVGYSDNKKFTIVGTGEAPVSFTSVPDIAGKCVVLDELPLLTLTFVKNRRICRVRVDDPTALGACEQHIQT